VQAACPLPEQTEAVRATFVIDGDTLVLEGGDKVRLIGIDAPELGRDDTPAQPFAADAKAVLADLVGSAGGRLLLLPGEDPRDRYGRRLSHAYDPAGINLGENLLRRGLAFQAQIPPNTHLAPCYTEAETEARANRRGLWTLPPLEADRLPRGREGFVRLAGRVESVRHARRTTWLELEGPLALRIADEDRHRFDPAMLAALPGERIEVRGWLYHHRGRPRMRLRDPSAILPP
jgi:endonuclease YncB( thermonuclease family)